MQLLKDRQVVVSGCLMKLAAAQLGEAMAMAMAIEVFLHGKTRAEQRDAGNALGRQCLTDGIADVQQGNIDRGFDGRAVQSAHCN